MTATAFRLLVVLFAASAMPGAGAAAQTPPDPARQQKPPDAASQQKPPDAPAQQQTNPADMPIDAARLRKALNAPPPVASPPKLDRENFGPMPRFSEEIKVNAKPLTLDFAEQLKASEKEDAYPYIYAPSIGDLAASVPELQYLHPVNAIMSAHKAIAKALYNRKVAKARREVQEELQALLAAQAAAAKKAGK